MGLAKAWLKGPKLETIEDIKEALQSPRQK